MAEGTAFLAQVPAVEEGAFFWLPGNFTGQAHDINIIKADGTALSVGAWVRQGAQLVSFKRPDTGAKIRSQEDRSSEIISMDDLRTLIQRLRPALLLHCRAPSMPVRWAARPRSRSTRR